MYEAVRLPEESTVKRCFTLRQEIPALQLVALENGQARWGPLIRLPRGAELHESGAGFDDKTLMVRFDGCFYIVFRQDLDAVHTSARTNKRALAHSA